MRDGTHSNDSGRLCPEKMGVNKGVMSIAYVAFVAPCDVYLICGICGFPSSSGSPHMTLALSGAQSGAKGGSFAGGEKVRLYK